MERVHIHVPYSQLDKYLDLLRQREYDLEIYCSAQALDGIQQGDLNKLVKRLDWSPALTLHAPFMDINPGADDPLVRSITAQRFRQVLDAADVLRPRAIVFHPAYFKWRYAGQMDVWLNNSMETWRMVSERASQSGYRIAIENVFDEDPEAIALLLDSIGHPDFGFCFDTGHFNLFSTVPMERWFERLGSRLVEVHLHDNIGDADSHWAVGRGNIDFEKFFGLIAAGTRLPVFTIEAHNENDIEESKKQVRALMHKYLGMTKAAPEGKA